jgi:hypothetical protein
MSPNSEKVHRGSTTPLTEIKRNKFLTPKPGEMLGSETTYENKT